MDDEKRQRRNLTAELAADVVKFAMDHDEILRWDEVVMAFGIAAKALAGMAASNDDGTLEECETLAKARLVKGFQATVVTVGPGAPAPEGVIRH